LKTSGFRVVLNAGAAKPRSMENTSFRALVEIELLLCDLLHHMQEGDVVDSYLLHGIELTEAHHAPNPSPVWNVEQDRPACEG
jgi:hypothetical protein